MNLGAPTKLVFFIALILGILGLVSFFGIMTFPYVKWVLPAAFILLVIGIVVPGL